HRSGRAVHLPGGLPQQGDLVVGVLNHGGGVAEHDGDVQGTQRGDEVVAVGGEEDQVGLIAYNGLDVGVPSGQVGRGRGLGVGGELVDRDDLVAGADREQELRGGGGQRDDPFGAGLDVHLAVGGV